jgi:hypothetical protein
MFLGKKQGQEGMRENISINWHGDKNFYSDFFENSQMKFCGQNENCRQVIARLKKSFGQIITSNFLNVNF